MAEFFDLSIPYHEDPKLPSSKTKSLWDSRVRSVARAAELGYAGVAYDRRLRGVAADHDCCRIPPLLIESLLSRAPALAASATLHRNLLGANPDTRFRQYTRVTTIVESKVAALSLNSAKEILRSYDIVAARPTTRDAFQILCKTAEIDLISIDFSQKLPFPLSLSLVQDAIKRGVYFEVTYSDLVDAGIRRQVLSNLRILVDWTRGKNLVFSSSALTANDIRGPYDVANLASFLLGLPMERAKAAISRNCRCLVATALRKKCCHREAIRIERFLPDEVRLDIKGVWSNDWNDWDPISSGDGDLTLSEKYSTESKHSGYITLDVASDIGNTTSNISLVEDSLNSQDSKGISFCLSKNLESAIDTSKDSFTIDEVLKRNERGKDSDSVPLPITYRDAEVFKCEDDVVLPVGGTKLSNDDRAANTCVVVNKSVGFDDDVVSEKSRMLSTESKDTIPICDNISDTCPKLSDIIESKNRFDSCIDIQRNLHVPDSNSDKTETTMAVTSVVNVPLGSANPMMSEDIELCCSLSLGTDLSNKQADIGQEDCKDKDVIKIANILDAVDYCSNFDSCIGDKRNLIVPVANSDKIETTTVVTNTMNGALCIAEQRTSEDDRICFNLHLQSNLLGKQVDGRPEYCKQKDLDTISNCSISEGVLIEQPSEKGNQTLGDSYEGNHGDKHELLISMEGDAPVADASELENLNQSAAAKTCSSAAYHPRTGKRKREEGYSFVANPLPTKHMLKAVFFRKKEWRLKRSSKHKM